MQLNTARFSQSFGAQGTATIIAAQAGQRVRIRALLIVITHGAVLGGTGLGETAGGATLASFGLPTTGSPIELPICPDDAFWWRTAAGKGVDLVWSIAGAGSMIGQVVYEYEADVTTSNVGNA